MKKLIPLILILATGALAQAAGNLVPISERTVTLNVDISTTRLKLSHSGYTSETVKVLVPELADVTLLDHRNTGEGAPCMATFDTLNPDDVIQNNPAVEKIPFQITLGKIAQVVPAAPGAADSQPVCEISLVENINGKIRGFQFTHSRQKVIATRSVDDCR